LDYLAAPARIARRRSQKWQKLSSGERYAACDDDARSKKVTIRLCQRGDMAMLEHAFWIRFF